nr:ABC transporter ATP-binding protein [Jiangella mangrovi]
MSFEAEEGELYALLGPSGCGKTTTLRCVAGLERPDSGRITLGDDVVFGDGKIVPGHRRDIGMVFQNYAVWPHMTVFDNTAFPLEVDGERRSKGSVEQAVGEALDLVGLSGYEGRMATQLSGGQQQRLSLARALVRRPRVLLLDEPLSNLDAKLREHMRQEIRLLQQRLSITTLFVTHDQVEALAMSDRIAVLRDGRIEQEGTPQEVYAQPATEFVAGFVGATNLVPGTVTAADDDGVTVRTGFGSVRAVGSAGTPVGGDVVLAIRPEDVEVRPRKDDDGADAAEALPNTWPVEVRLASFTGAITDLRLAAEGDQELMARSFSRNAVQGPDAVMHLPVAACRVLPADGAGA